MEQLDYKLIGERVKAVRKGNHLTQQALASIVDVATSHISNIETGSTKVSLPTLLKISNALETTLDQLLYTNLQESAEVVRNDVDKILQDCSKEEIRIILLTITALKKALKNL